MAMVRSKRRIKNAVRVLAEINAASFRYYVLLYLSLAAVDFFKGDFFVGTFHFPLKWLLWFVVVSGVANILFDLGSVRVWTWRKTARKSFLAWIEPIVSPVKRVKGNPLQLARVLKSIFVIEYGKKTNYILLGLMGLVGGVTVYSEVRMLGEVSYPIAVVAGVVIILLLRLISEVNTSYVDENKPDADN